jgi:hypothetical protein
MDFLSSIVRMEEFGKQDVALSEPINPDQLSMHRGSVTVTFRWDQTDYVKVRQADLRENVNYS